MQLLFGLGSLAVEYSLRFLLLLYMVPVVFMMMGARSAAEGAFSLFRPVAAFGSRAEQLRQVAGLLRKGSILVLLAGVSFLAIFHRAEIFQCLARLF